MEKYYGVRFATAKIVDALPLRISLVGLVCRANRSLGQARATSTDHLHAFAVAFVASVVLQPLSKLKCSLRKLISTQHR